MRGLSISKPTVLIAYKSLPQYRVAFFERLRDCLATRGITLRVTYGDAIGQDSKKADTAVLPWATYRRNLVLSFGDKSLVYQPIILDAQSADLVIVEQASKLLTNYGLLAMQSLGHPKVALWGHGRNFQASDNMTPAERVKRMISTKAHWWFAYNATSATVLEGIGYPKNRITLVQNAIDTSSLKSQVAAVTEDELGNAKTSIGLRGNNVGLFIGGMYKHKRLEFLVDSCRRVREELPDFELVLAGAGESQRIAEEAAQAEDWVHYVGPAFGDQKAILLRLAKAILMPGLVGLVVLDSFAAGTPMITTAVPFHSPEIEYLQPGVNGLIVEDACSIGAFAHAVVRVFTDAALQRHLAEGCRSAAQKYTVEAMVDNFSGGIVDALAT